MGNVIKKSIVGVIVGAILFGATNVLGFPFVFQAMFFAYAMLGTVVFILLDAPSLKALTGAKAIGALIVFYVILCVVFIAGASLWPQYDPEDERGKINQILKPKRERYEAGKIDVLMERAKALDEKAKELTARLQIAGSQPSCFRSEGRRRGRASRHGRGGCRRRRDEARGGAVATAGMLQLPQVEGRRRKEARA